MNDIEEKPNGSRTIEVYGPLTFQQKLKHFLKIYWNMIFAISWPLFLTSIFIIDTHPAFRCAFLVLMMAGYWMVECIPLTVTSLLPVFMFPAMGILNSTETCVCYMNDAIMVFIGGLILAFAVEHSNLHLRIALSIMKTIGCSHSRLLGGLCIVTTISSMWIPNAGATTMMIPIIFAILSELERAGIGTVFTTVKPGNADAGPRPTRITLAYLLSAAYCSTFGGTGTLVGTSTNLIFKGVYEHSFPEGPEVNFITWTLAALPQMAINSFLTWIYLRITYLGWLRPESKDAKNALIGLEGEQITNQVIQQRSEELGPITFHELAVSVLFVLSIILWVLRKPGYMPGWAELISNEEITDSAPIMLIAVLMFFIPRDLNILNNFSNDLTKIPEKKSEGLITWKFIESKMPWSLVFLLGAGFAIAKGSKASNLANKLGNSFSPLKNLHQFWVLIIILLFVGTFSEFTSNVGAANIILPIIAQMSVAMEIHPLYLMVPATLMCSFSFRMPTGTPPNAIIALQGHIPIKWLIQGGCLPIIYSTIVLSILSPTWICFVLNVKGFPEWAKHINQTESLKERHKI